MPTAPADFSGKAAVTLFQLLQKSVNGISLKAAESKKLDKEFEYGALLARGVWRHWNFAGNERFWRKDHSILRRWNIFKKIHDWN
jgi:hypothetical protein